MNRAVAHPQQDGQDRPGPTTRLSVNIGEATAQVLQKHKARGISITETVRRACAVYDLIESEAAKGSKIQIVDRDGTTRELLLIP
ncbi:CopG family transcriptional regulator [Streptomyces sp. SB3404]|uniref:CopG family transcriptional regulator n=2 Tax=Streptomyces boncukensis TaxID=2711219 RepID=A0A6G4X2S8_9ACTN|nr:CopG family transcriptional regulator [Streptomyces boncukensis]